MTDGTPVNWGGWGNPIRLIIVAVVIAGCIGIAYVAAHAAGVAIPGFVITILWIVFAVVVAVLAIRFIASLIP
jgi:hypothetical protein